MNALVGYTGFVGSNLCVKGSFDCLYNSKNIVEAYGTKPDLLVYAGVRAEMFLANNFTEKDFSQIKDAFENIKKIAPKHVVLISTISVCGENPLGDEDIAIDEGKLTAYGKNRLWLEKAVAGEFEKSLIARLPALYGKNLKKNFIYDYIHIIPSLLKYEKFEELSLQNAKLGGFYERQDNGFYKCRALDASQKKDLIAFFKSCGFSALNFTDSRSCYQFYNLSFLWEHIQKAIDFGIKKLISTSYARSANYIKGKPLYYGFEIADGDQHADSGTGARPERSAGARRFATTVRTAESTTRTHRHAE